MSLEERFWQKVRKGGPGVRRLRWPLGVKAALCHSYWGQYAAIAAAKIIWAIPRDNVELFAIAPAAMLAGDCPAARPAHIARAPAVAAPASVIAIPSAVISDRNWASCSAVDGPRDTGGGGAGGGEGTGAGGATVTVTGGGGSGTGTTGGGVGGTTGGDVGTADTDDLPDDDAALWWVKTHHPPPTPIAINNPAAAIAAASCHATRHERPTRSGGSSE